MSSRGGDPEAGVPMCGQSGTDQYQGQLSSFCATTDWPTMIVQATGKFKNSATCYTKGNGTYIRWLIPRISGSRVAGVPVIGLAVDQGGSAPRRAAAPVPRAETGAGGSPARTRMLSAALWSAFARNPQAPHANTACDGRFDLAVCPQRLQACEV